MLKRTLALLMSLTIAATSMSGCGTSTVPAPAPTPIPAADSKPAAAPADAKSAEKVIELEFWVRNSDKFDEKELIDFEKQNPGIKVKMQKMGANYDELMQKFMTAAASDSLPDVAMIGQRHGIPQLYDSGKLIPIEEFMSDTEQNDILPAYWERFTYKGKRTTVPFQASMPVLFYNADMLKAKNVAVPTTFDEIVTAAKQLTQDTNGDGVTDVYGFNMNSDTAWYVQPLVSETGNEVIKEDGSVSINNEGYKKVLSTISRMAHVDKSMPVNQHKTSEDDFSNGLSALFLNSCAANGKIEKAINGKFNYGIALFPKIDNLSVPIGGNSLGIFRSDAEHEAAAWKLVQYLISPQSIAESTIQSGYIPISQQCMSTDIIKKSMEDPRRKVIIEQLQYLKPQKVNPADSTIWNESLKMLEVIEADPKADVTAELDKVQKIVDNFLADYAKKQ